MALIYLTTRPYGFLFQHAESVQSNSRGQRPRNEIRAKRLTLKGSNYPALVVPNDTASNFPGTEFDPFRFETTLARLASGDVVTGYLICPLRGQRSTRDFQPSQRTRYDKGNQKCGHARNQRPGYQGNEESRKGRVFTNHGRVRHSCDGQQETADGHCQTDVNPCGGR